MKRVIHFFGSLVLLGAIIVACTPADTTGPTVTVTAPLASTSFVEGTVITITGTVSDKVGVSKVTAQLNDEEPVEAEIKGNEWSVTLHAPSAGEHTVTIRATDLAGNTTTTTIKITTTKPPAVVGEASGQVERVPPVGSGRPTPPDEGPDAIGRGLASELLQGERARGTEVAPLGLSAPNRIVVAFEPSPRLVLPASASVNEVLQWQASIDAIAQDFSRYGVVAGNGIVPGQGLAVFEVAAGADVDAAVASMRRDARVRHAERDHWVYANAAPNDPGFAFQWSHEITDAQVAWATSTGSHAVRVAVIDSGSGGTIGSDSRTGEHPDLLPNLIPGYDFVTALDLEDDPLWVNTDEYLALKERLPQVQFLDGDGDPGWDPYPLDEFATVYEADPATGESWIEGLETFGSHGTHVAGIVGAVGNNASGLAGVNWNVQIQPIRALGHIGAGLGSDVLAGVAYAAGFVVFQDGYVYRNPTPAHVINMSLGGGPYSEVADDLYQAVREQGVLVVASAGNSSSSAPHYPSGYDSVMSVSSVDYIHWTDDLNGPGVVFSDFFSNWGETIDISAPGGLGWQTAEDFNAANFPAGLMADPFVISTGWRWFDVADPAVAEYVNAPTFYYSAGTSMSAPYVSGAAALLLAIDPTLSPDELVEILTGTATRVDDSYLEYSYGEPEEEWDPFYGYGVLNLPAAVEAAKSGVVARIPSKTYVEAINADDESDVYRVVAATDYTFSFDALPAGDWKIRAGVDVNGNGKIGDEGEYYGEFEGLVTISKAEPVVGDVSFILGRQP